MPKYIAARDQGTTSTRCILFDHGGYIVASDQKEHQQIYPIPGWVEHDALEIWEHTQHVIRGALEKSGGAVSDIAAIGVTNQRETTLVWERATGRPVKISLRLIINAAGPWIDGTNRNLCFLT